MKNKEWIVPNENQNPNEVFKQRISSRYTGEALDNFC
jgi:hypothetical protein